MRPRKHSTLRQGRRRPPPSGRKPTRRLTMQDIALSADELQAFQARFQELFTRQEHWDWFRFFMCGQLSELERKTVEPMVLALLGANVNAIRAAQYFLGQAPWETRPFVERVQTLVAAWLGEADGVAIVDGSGFPKQGAHSAGVAAQYCGHVGKVTNCQEGAFVLYASRRGYAFVDKRLYLPECWFTPDYQDRWKACGIPDDVTFHTEPKLALEMLTQLVQRAVVPFRWVTCDEKYGENPAFLDGSAALGKWYFAEAAVDTRVWRQTPPVEPPGQGLFGAPRRHPRVKPTAPRPDELRDLVWQIPRTHWRRGLIKEGGKGPLVAEFACLRVTPVRDKLPGERCWAIFRRTLGAEPEVKFFLSNAPRTCSLDEFVRISGLRWPVETGLKEAKGAVGMDQYETRTWLGWHHQMTLAFLDHLFLVRLQLVIQKKSGADHCPSPSAHCACHQRRPGAVARHIGYRTVSPIPQLRGVSVTPQANPCAAYPPAPKAAETPLLVVIPNFS